MDIPSKKLEPDKTSYTYKGGFKAAKEGKRLNDCPYKSSGNFSKARFNWMCGWLDYNYPTEKEHE